MTFFFFFEGEANVSASKDGKSYKVLKLFVFDLETMKVCGNNIIYHKVPKVIALITFGFS